MEYNVKYKPIKGMFWKTLENVVGDGFVEGSNPSVRFFILKNFTRIEIPCNNTIFIFGPDRTESIKKSKIDKS